MAAFFVPLAKDGMSERLYAALAAQVGRPVPPMSERIARIGFVHDGEDWVAEVGQTLRGTRTKMAIRNGRRRSVTTPLSDPATVLAIFAGIPFMVCTSAGIDSRSRWVNPFMAGQPGSVEYFTS